MTLNVVGVLGGGVMGAGVAQNLAQTSHRVVLVDVSEEVLANTRKTIADNVRLQRLMGGPSPKEGVEGTLQRITFTTDYELLRTAEFIIENVTEKWDIKSKVYAQLETVASPDCILAANTSAISITRLASLTTRPSKVIGIHFMNPVPAKPTVEIIRGHHTSEVTIATTKGLLAAMGKEGILVNDHPGFVSNRVLMLTINEAIFLIQDGVAGVEDVDKVFKTCFGHKMGPLETADLIGLDTILYSVEVLYESYNDSKYRPCPLLKKMVDAGLFGRKNGKGFYSYGLT